METIITDKSGLSKLAQMILDICEQIEKNDNVIADILEN